MSLTVVGEALVDVLVRPDGTRTERPGGSCLNVAVAAARLGVTTTLVTQVADDEHGALLRSHAAASGVALDTDVPASGRTATATATIAESGSATYDFDLSWSLSVRPAPVTRALHVGSLGTLLSPGAEAVAAMVEAAADDPATLISYDPNVRPSFLTDEAAALEAVRSWAARADLVKLSDEDCATLAPGVEPTELAASLVGGRTRLVVLTRGGEGATAFAEDLVVEVESPSVRVADTVGAGDTFSAGLVAAMLVEDRLGDDAWYREELCVRRVLTSAAAAAAVTVTRPGADPPRRHELGEWPRG